MKEFLLEIGVEEIPSNLLPIGMKTLENIAGKMFKENRLEFEGMKSYGTPRRLILHVKKLADKQAEVSEEIVGPPKKISYDESGNLTQTGIKFAQGQGVAIKDLKVKVTAKGEYLSAIRKKPVLNSAVLLKSALPELIQSVTFSKSMVWGPSRIRFVRPIRWIVALYGEKTIPFQLGEVKTAPISYGHRFLGPRPVRVKNFLGYERQLRKQYVLIDPEERKACILKNALQLGNRAGGRAEITEEFLDQAVNLTEFPVVFKGDFDESFLELPKEVIMNAMCEHQGYFPLLAAKGGRLLPSFIAVSNIRSPSPKIVQKGNERVLRSRLSDAQFYFESDLKVRLSDRIEGLQKVVYQEKLGTQAERVNRLSNLAGQIAEWVSPRDTEFRQDALRAGLLSKADLITGVVREFPKLQGIIGKEYALRQGEFPAIARALEEQYLPKYAGGPIPESLLGKILSIADKIDAITGSFGAGLAPTGSEDPYGLRRQGAGLIHILLTFDPSPFSLNDLISSSIAQFHNQNKLAVEVQKPVREFLKQRYEFILESRGYRSDIIQAVTSIEFQDLTDEQKRIAALAKFSRNPKFIALSIAFKRLNNIIPKEYTAEPLVPARLVVEEEKQLHEAIQQKTERINDFLKKHQYESILELFSEIREPLDRFFTAVMVNDPDPAIRKNRLALVNESLTFLKSFADFSRIMTES
ncbi:MAG: glycine--tRNA ligase subunit beta [Nitrospirae bacterium]|nr:glycine--tRNA ligase subunit beta [Nitrospirota bacterium]